MTRQTERFGFGKNWENFVKKHFNEDRVTVATDHLLRFLQKESLSEQYFLDIGCGSGLHSLAALRANAGRIVSFDYDSKAVNTTQGLKYYAGSPQNWEVCQGSILDDAFVRRLQPADIVYSWGVLHHTGDMWRAMDNSAGLVKNGGCFYVALYDYDIQVNPRPEYWLDVKRRYNRSSRIGRRRMELWYIWNYSLNRRLRNVWHLIRRVAQYKQERGMAFYTDVVDWLGGWPMEFAKREDVRRWAEKSGLSLLKMKTGEANTEYLFRR